MDSDSENESIEGEVEVEKSAADWGKSKYDYYYTDYVDKDYPSKLTAKEERLATIELEEALRIQKKLLSTLEDIDIQAVYDDERENRLQDASHENLIDALERHNKSVGDQSKFSSKKRKKVQFEDQDSCADDSEIGSSGEEDDDTEEDEKHDDNENIRQRRPVNMAIRKNRGLTPYKKKEYRNPRVKHKLKYKKAMSKRRRLVREAAPQLHRYSGEASGIKTSTIKSIKLS